MLPANHSRQGRTALSSNVKRRCEREKTMLDVQVYRYNPERDTSPYMQSLSLPEEFRNRMVLDALEYLRAREAMAEHA